MQTTYNVLSKMTQKAKPTAMPSARLGQPGQPRRGEEAESENSKRIRQANEKNPFTYPFTSPVPVVLFSFAILLAADKKFFT